MPNGQLDKQLIGMAGEYLVAANLCLRGYVASLTWKNYPKVDIFAHNPRNNRQVEIQVKTTRDQDQYFVPEDVNAGDPVFVFVHINDNSVQYYVVPAADVGRISANEREEYLQNHHRARAEQPRMISVDRIQEFIDRWDLLNLD